MEGSRDERKRKGGQVPEGKLYTRTGRKEVKGRTKEEEEGKEREGNKGNIGEKG